MVVFVDLEGEDDDSPELPTYIPKQHRQLAYRHYLSRHGLLQDREDYGDVVPQTKSYFAKVLDCYPATESIACHLDLNDLDSLSRTCRSIRSSLTQFRNQLVAKSLRCSNDEIRTMTDVVTFYNAAKRAGIPINTFPNRIFVDDDGGTPANSSLLRPPKYLPTKLSACARDLVAPCRKCGITVCRNCASKPLSDRYLTERLRRLCRACLDAPLSAHLRPPPSHIQDVLDTPAISSQSSTRSNRSVSDSSHQSTDTRDLDPSTEAKPFTTPAFLRSPCNCATKGAYLCSPCAVNLRSADTTYKRVWTWRSRYSTHIGGGLGTGLGQGDQGQKCGRGSKCLENGLDGVCWVEIDCSEPVAGFQHGSEESLPLSSSRNGTAFVNTVDGENGVAAEYLNRPGYLSQEVEGIGGVVKKKVKKRMKVGATVWEYEDERESGKYLAREASGKERSWCGWCDRICLGEEDRKVYRTGSG